MSRPALVVGMQRYFELLHCASRPIAKNRLRCSAGMDFRSSSRNSDDARCRVERDLHDGAQQLLVALGLVCGRRKRAWLTN
jgi:signal transduction histidine kinase